MSVEIPRAAIEQDERHATSRLPTKDEPGMRWPALMVVCLGALLTVLDGSIVNVALPSIRTDLGFSHTALVWTVNAYMVTFGGFVLLGARMGDLLGQRTVFMFGVALFTLASAGCVSALSPLALVLARAIQGLGGAGVTATALSLTINLFPEPAERARALGMYGCVGAAGGILGLLLGGLLTGTVGWRWVFLINLPVGAATYVLCQRVVPRDCVQTREGRFDIAGAVTVTLAMVLAVFGILSGADVGWGATNTIVALIAAGMLLSLFFIIEGGARAPLVPLRLFRVRSLPVASVIAVLWAAALYGWFYDCALYLRAVLGLTPLQVGLCFLPANVGAAVFGLGVSPKLVLRFGIKPPLVAGCLVAACGFSMFATVRLNGHVATDVLPGMLVCGIGMGMAFNPLLLAAASGIASSETGLASGVVNTAYMMGAAIGVALMTSIAVQHTSRLLALGSSLPAALNSGYHLAFILGTTCAIAAAVTSAALLPKRLHS